MCKQISVLASIFSLVFSSATFAQIGISTTQIQPIDPVKVYNGVTFGPTVISATTTPQQIQALSLATIQALTPTQILALSLAQVEALSAWQIKAMTPVQIQALNQRISMK